MTEAMPFLQKTILLSYDPRLLERCSFFKLTHHWQPKRSGQAQPMVQYMKYL